MIRLPLTSISLSNTDINQHLHEIDEYRSLLKQGFQKKDVQEYFEGRQRANADVEGSVNDEFDVLIDAVQLANHHLKSMVSPVTQTIKDASSKESPHSNSAPDDDDGKRLLHSSSIQSVGSPQGPVESAKVTEAHNLNTKLPSQAFTSDAEIDQIDVIGHQSRHASHLYTPRQSSLLRFTVNVTYDEEFIARQDKSVSCSPEVTIPYRSRTDEQPDCDPHNRESGDEQVGTTVEGLGKLELRKRRWPRDPGKGHEGTVAMSANESSYELNDTQASSSPDMTKPELTYVSSISIDEMQPPALLMASPALISSSPPVSRPCSPVLSHDFYSHDPNTSSNHALDTEISPPALDEAASIHITPQAAVLDNRSTRVEDRPRIRAEHPFLIYNDRLPPETQPQTPADLQPRNTIDGQNIRYTAPPGMISYGWRAREHSRAASDIDGGDVSPTMRAINLRNRRNREFRRSATVEGVRLNRMTEGHFERIEIWRDDLEADRVGEENYGLDQHALRVLVRDGMRTFSNSQTEFSE